MSRIRSKQIVDRLNGTSARVEHRHDPNPKEVASSGNTLFACSVVGLIVAGAGIGFAASDRSAGARQAIWTSLVGPPPYRSRVADICNVGWKDEGDNRDQIHCHMTQEVERLCDRRERTALIEKLYEYEAADARSRLHVVFNVMTRQGDVMQMGMAEARSRDPNLTEQQRNEQLNKTIAISQQLMAPIQQTQVKRTKYKTLVADVRSLVESGYLAAADFDSRKPDIVTDGLASVQQTGKPSCK